jgi:hypothetical protein
MKTSTALFLLAAPVAFAQNAPAVSQREIDDAISRGLTYLKTAPSPGGHLQTNCDELIFLTILHGGMSEKDPVFKKYLESALTCELKHTYKVALLAMCLEELDRVKYQVRIAHCAQFLIDNQCANGQWTYGRPTDLKHLPYVEQPSSVASGSKPRNAVVEFDAERMKPKVVRRLAVKRNAELGGASGDNSNTQYAALGLRACYDAGIDLPEATVHLARKWLVDSQCPDEGAKAAGDKKAVASGADAIRGWNYKDAASGNPYHAMTAGAVGAVVIYDYILGMDWKKDPVARAGAAWLGKHFSVNTNYYYMYGLERAGMLYGTDTFGTRAWYPEGAALLLKQQKADGSWGNRENKDENTWDTCFAILFLKKATRAIATEGSRKK